MRAAQLGQLSYRDARSSPIAGVPLAQDHNPSLRIADAHKVPQPGSKIFARKDAQHVALNPKLQPCHEHGPQPQGAVTLSKLHSVSAFDALLGVSFLFSLLKKEEKTQKLRLNGTLSRKYRPMSLNSSSPCNAAASVHDSGTRDPV